MMPITRLAPFAGGATIGGAMATGDDLLAAVGAVHAAGLDAELWPQALAAVTRTVGGVGATLEVIEKPGLRPRDFHFWGLPPVEQTEYLNHYASLSPRLPFVARQESGELTWDYLAVDERSMNRSAFYAEFLPRMDLRYYVGGILANTQSEFAAVTVQRSGKQGHVGRAEIALMERILPHVRQALDVATRLKGAGGIRRSLEGALDWLTDGVAVVRGDGTVVHANAAFRTIARASDGIAVRKGAVEFADSKARARLAAAIGESARLRAGDTRASISDFHAARRSAGAPYLVSVRPLLKNQADPDAGIAMIFVRDLLDHDTAAIRTLRDVFGFTAAEASIAQALQAGTSLGEYARTHALSLNTIYTHLRRIKEKAGCHRMAELVRKLGDLQMPLRRD